jgi:hypothetical protein
MFSMVQIHHWSITEVENMMPWERDIYMEKLIQHVKEENDKIKEQNRKNQYG